MIQIEKVEEALQTSLPNFEYTLERVQQQNQTNLEIKFSSRYSLFDVFKTVQHLDKAFNTTREEQDDYPYKIVLKTSSSSEIVNELSEKLKLLLVSNDNISQKVLNKRINGRLEENDNLQIKLKVNNLRHLIENDFENMATTVPTVDSLISQLLSTKTNEEKLELNAFLANADFVKSLNSVRDLYKDTYYAVGFEEFFQRIVERKTGNFVERQLENIKEINKNIITMTIRKYRQTHSDVVERLFGTLTNEDLESTLFNIPMNFKYEDTLNKYIKLEFEGSNLSPVEQEIFKYSDNKKQTIHTLDGFSHFDKKVFEDNQYIQKDFNEDSSLILTDDLMIIKLKNEISTKITKDFNEKLSTLLTFIS